MVNGRRCPKWMTFMLGTQRYLYIVAHDFGYVGGANVILSCCSTFFFAILRLLADPFGDRLTS